MAEGLLHFDWDAPLADADRDRILERLAGAVRKWRMEVPALLLLETTAPLSHLGGQGLIAFSPFVAPLLPRGLADVQRLSKFLERPDNVRRLIDLIADAPPEPATVGKREEEADAARE